MPEKICKTIHQYNKEPIPKADMQQLLEIAEDYKKVKNYVYGRYGGIGSLFKIYPGYTVQNEMTAGGYRGNTGDAGSLFLPGSLWCAGRYQEPVDTDEVEACEAGQQE